MTSGRWVGVAALLALQGCGSDKVAEPPHVAPSGSVPSPIIVSSPIARAAFLSGSDSTGTVVFLSAPPHSLDGVVQVVVRGAGAQTTIDVQDGGFDPVRVNADSGDVLVVSRIDERGAPTSEEMAVRMRRPPRVVRISPAPQRTDVPLNAVIRVVFSAPIDLESARTGIVLTAADTVVPGTILPAGDVAVDYQVAGGSLAPETTYRLEVTTEVRDVLGQALAEPVSLEFRTGTEVTPAPTVAFDLAITPRSIALDQGASAEATLTLTRGTVRGEAFTGGVTLSATAPAGVSVSFSSTRLETGVTTATIQLTADAAATVGGRTVTVRAVSDGPGAVTLTRQLVVGVALAPPTIGLGVSPTSVTLVRGGRTETVETWAWGAGMTTGAAELSVTGQPDGVGVWPLTTSMSLPSSMNISLVATGAAAPGTTRLLVTATLANERGSVKATKIIDLTVVEPSGSVRLVPSQATLGVVANAPPISSTIAIERTAPFSGPVELSVGGTPNGVTATISPATSVDAFATLSVSAAQYAMNGTYILSLGATGGGIATTSAMVAVSITGGADGRKVTFNPASVTVTAGGSDAVATVTPALPTAPARQYLQLIRSMVPDGVALLYNSRSGTLTIRADSSVLPGTYPLVVTVRALSPDPDISHELYRGQLPITVLAAP